MARVLNPQTGDKLQGVQLTFGTAF
jgi:hypothetical protein